MEQLHAIEKELRDYESEIYECAAEFKTVNVEAAGKRAIYDVAYAQELLKISMDKTLKMTVPEKDATTLLAVQHQFTECRIAEAMAEACKRRLTALQANLTSVQTRSSLLKTERSLVNGWT